MCAQLLHLAQVSKTNRCRICPTRTVCLASFVPDEQVDELPGLFQCSDAMAAGEHLYHAGDEVIRQCHVRSGMVKTYVINAEGDEYVTGFYLPGEIVGHHHVDGRHVESAVALQTTTICEIDEVATQAVGYKGLTAPLLRHMAANASLESRHQINLKQSSAQARFAGFCALMAGRLERLGRDPRYLPTPMSRTDIASYLGMTLESLSRVVSKLNAAQVIRASREQIEILQRETLDTLSLHVRT
jgi:CRP/FNR family transcriptional regulator